MCKELRMAGRKPLGPALVEHLEGSDNAKERLELILSTLAGQISVVAAAERLGISEAMFYKVRNRVLQVCLEDLEPKPLGRPPIRLTEDQQQRQKLDAQVTALQHELAAQTVRVELLQALPHVVQSPPTGKKTARQTLLKQKLRQRRQRNAK
jgi:transposase-like protein